MIISDSSHSAHALELHLGYILRARRLLRLVPLEHPLRSRKIGKIELHPSAAVK